ncbi:3732_t:CDS:10, partial [Diversispora eburnea]
MAGIATRYVTENELNNEDTILVKSKYVPLQPAGRKKGGAIPNAPDAPDNLQEVDPKGSGVVNARYTIYKISQKMVTDQNHSSDISREQEVIRYMKILAQAFGLDKQNAEVYSALSDMETVVDLIQEIVPSIINKKLSKNAERGNVYFSKQATFDFYESSSSEENGESNVQVDECYQPKKRKENCHDIQVFHFAEARDVKDTSMLIQRCLSIEYLDFAGVMAFRNDALIVAIIRASPNLRHLEISHNDIEIGHNDIGDEVTEALAHTCHKLEYLDPDCCDFVSEPSICNVIRSCPKLQHLNLSYCNITRPTVKGRSTCEKPDIKHVGVCGSSANFPQNPSCKNNAKIDSNNEFVVGTSQILSVDGLKNYIVGEIGTARFDLYKNSVHLKNLMDTKKAILNYFNPEKDDKSISIKKLVNSFCQVNVARNKTIVAKRSEITLWCLFSKKFEDKVVELRSEDKKLADKTARSQIYTEMKPYLADVSDGYLRVMTCKARKINKLFGYEYDPVTLKKIDGIPGYMVNQVTYSADKISKLTNPQIDYIIEQVKSKTITSHVNKIFETVATTSAHNSDYNFSDASLDVTDYFKSDNEFEFDANKSDSDVYFKSNNSDSDDDHELHERLTCEEMARIAKLENKTPTKPKEPSQSDPH